MFDFFSQRGLPWKVSIRRIFRFRPKCSRLLYVHRYRNVDGDDLSSNFCSEVLQEVRGDGADLFWPSQDHFWQISLFEFSSSIFSFMRSTDTNPRFILACHKKLPHTKNFGQDSPLSTFYGLFLKMLFSDFVYFKFLGSHFEISILRPQKFYFTNFW